MLLNSLNGGLIQVDYLFVAKWNIMFVLFVVCVVACVRIRVHFAMGVFLRQSTSQRHCY